ncbi:MAG: D-erythronate dehydrogenase [Burkholderiaceae bacterium]
MKIVITGGGGFVGQRLAQAILEGPGLALAESPDNKPALTPVTQIVCVDMAAGALRDERLSYVTGDVSDPALIESAIDKQTNLVYHLAAVVSGTAEADFDLGQRVNVIGTRNVLERCRELGTCPRLVFSSSIAVFGGELPDVITDATTPMPQGSYGIQKLIGELMVQDYSRKGFIKGCSLRLPTVVVRPGKPNGAASSFASGVIREPLAGVAMDLPVDPATHMWSTSPAAVVRNLIHAAQLPPQAWGQWRSLNLPGLVHSMNDALDALESLGGAHVRSLVSFKPDPDIVRLVSTWAAHLETKRALSMGFIADPDFMSVVRAYVTDYADAVKVPIK